jgi:hypothetical protein
MVISLLADANIQVQVAILAARMQGQAWRDFWDDLGLRLVTFPDVGLRPSDSDAVVWRRCQEQGLLLLTDNRNVDGAESLEATIRAHTTPTSLPVFTIGNVRSLSSDSGYANRVIERLFIYLLELDDIRGTGRLYLP